MGFKENLRTLRKAHGYTQKELAEKLNYGSSTICNYEMGVGYPNLLDLIRLSKMFSVSTDALLGIVDEDVEWAIWRGKYNMLSEEGKKDAVQFLDYLLYRGDETEQKREEIEQKRDGTEHANKILQNNEEN